MDELKITPNDQLNIKLDQSDLLGLKLAEDNITYDIKMDTVTSVGTDDYNSLINKPIHYDTTANWNSQIDLIGKENHLYIYSDYKIVNGVPVPAMKVGDGKAYLVDIPFLDGNGTQFEDHIQDTNVHIQDGERIFWNNKVTCFISQGDNETVVFTKKLEEEYGRT